MRCVLSPPCLGLLSMGLSTIIITITDNSTQAVIPICSLSLSACFCAFIYVSHFFSFSYSRTDEGLDQFNALMVNIGLLLSTGPVRLNVSNVSTNLMDMPFLRRTFDAWNRLVFHNNFISFLLFIVQVWFLDKST